MYLGAKNLNCICLLLQTIDDFRLKIEYLRNYSNFINEKTEDDTTNLQLSIWFLAAQIGLLDFGICKQHFRASFQNQIAAFEHIAALRKLKRHPGILLHK